MTETAPTAPPPPPAREELVRLEDDRLWLGVCAAIGRATGTDPVLWRVATIVLTFFGGSGLLIYGAGWFLIRDESQPESVAERVLRGRKPHLTPTNIVVLALMGLGVVALLQLLTPWDGNHGPSLAPLAVVALLAYVVLRRQPPVPVTSSVAAPVRPAATAPEPYAAPVSYADVPAPVPAVNLPPPPPRRQRRAGPPVAALTISAAVVAAGLLTALSALGVDGITVPRTLAAVLAVLGVGLVVGARYGRQLLLLTLALLVGGALNVAARLDIPWDASVGDRTWTVVSPDPGADHQLGIGDGRLDLIGLKLQQDTTLHASVGVGELEVTVPNGTRVRVIGTVSLGAYDVLDPEVQGSDRHAGGNDLDVDTTFGPSTGPVLTLDAQVGVGHLEVHHG